jgi:excisionase family DNA binding protein
MEKLLTSHQVAKLLNVWPHTLRRWEREGKLKPLRTPGGHRRYKESQIMAIIGEDITENEAKQADAGNLQRQKERLIAYAVEKGYQVKAVYTEIASGLNENRRELAKLAKVATKGEIEIIVIEYKDRLARFGYKYLEQYYQSCGVCIDIMELNEEKSPQEELVDDMIAIVTSFSARIYGKRGGRVAKKLTKLIEQEVVAGEDHS